MSVKMIRVNDNYIRERLSRVNPHCSVDGSDYNRIVDLYNLLVSAIDRADYYEGHDDYYAEDTSDFDREFWDLYYHHGEDFF